MSHPFTMSRNVDFLQQDHYHQTLKVYYKISEERTANIDCLRQETPSALQKLQLGKDKQKFNVLSVGAGDGLVDLEIVNIVEEGYLNKDPQFQKMEIFNTGVEPVQAYAKKYQEFFENRAKRERSVKFEFKPMTFEQYVNTEHDRNQYDLIHAIHSLYFVDSIESTLNHCYHHELGDRGLIVCMLLAPDCTFNKIREVMNKTRTEDNKKELMRTADDIVSVAEAKQWKFARFYHSYRHDVSQILKETTEEGKLFLDFLTFETHFLGTADQESVGNVWKLLQDMSTEDEGGRLMLNEASELVIIYKA